MFWPFMPDTADKILESIGLNASEEKEKNFKKLTKWGDLPENITTKKPGILFPRI